MFALFAAVNILYDLGQGLTIGQLQLPPGDHGSAYDFQAGVVVPPAASAGSAATDAYSLASAQAHVSHINSTSCRAPGLAAVLQTAAPQLQQVLLALGRSYLTAHAQAATCHHHHQQQQQQQQQQCQQRVAAWPAQAPLDQLFSLVTPGMQVQLLSELVMAMCVPRR